MPYSAIEAKEIAKLCNVVDCEHKTAPYVNESDYLVVRTSNVRNGQLVMDGMKFTTMDGESRGPANQGVRNQGVRNQGVRVVEISELR